MPKPQQYKSLWTLLSRLPIYASLQSTVAFTTKLSPLINAHLTAQLPATNQGPVTIKSISIEAQSLIIACTSAGVATRLKHTQSSLLERLNMAIQEDAELAQLCTSYPIKKLKITVSSDFTQGENAVTTAPHSNHQAVERRTSSATVDLINSVSKSLPSDELANSLKNLADTLKKQNS